MICDSKHIYGMVFEYYCYGITFGKGNIMKKLNNIAVCWAKQTDKNFLEKSLDESWELTYVNNFESLDVEMNRGAVDLALVKLEKGNIHDIINSKMKLKILQEAYGVPIAFFVKYDNPFMEANYQMLIVEDTEIITVNAKNIEKIIMRIIPGYSMYSSFSDYEAYQLDGRSYNYAV